MPKSQFEGYIEHDTNRAILFKGHYWDTPDFLPKSQIEIYRDPDSDEVVVVLSAWIGGQKGLEETNFG